MAKMRIAIKMRGEVSGTFQKCHIWSIGLYGPAQCIQSSSSPGETLKARCSVFNAGCIEQVFCSKYPEKNLRISVLSFSKITQKTTHLNSEKKIRHRAEGYSNNQLNCNRLEISFRLSETI